MEAGVVPSNEQEIAASVARETARRAVDHRLALATGLQRAVELAEQYLPAAATPIDTSELARA